MSRVMAIDYGERRIGLAVSDPLRMIATPAGHILRRAGKRPPIAEIVRRAQEREVERQEEGLGVGEEGERHDQHEHYGSDLNQFARLHTGGDHRVCVGSRVGPCVDVGIAGYRMNLPIVDVRADIPC